MGRPEFGEAGSQEEGYLLAVVRHVRNVWSPESSQMPLMPVALSIIVDSVPEDSSQALRGRGTLPPELEGKATISVEEAARLFGIGRAAAYNAVNRGQLPSIRIGRRLLIPVPQLIDLLCGGPRDAHGRPIGQGQEL